VLRLASSRGELDPLGSPPEERRRRLTEFHIVKPTSCSVRSFWWIAGMFSKCRRRLLDVHLQHLRDRLALEANLQRFAVEPMSLAHRASDQTSARKSISSFVDPLPSQASHRPLLTLKRTGPACNPVPSTRAIACKGGGSRQTP